VDQVLRIRILNHKDLTEVRRVHEKFYSHEFELPDDHYLGSFIVEDKGELITAGGIRTLAEIIAVTNKGASTRKRIEAIEMLFQASSLVCCSNGYDQVHAFVQDENWMNILLKRGFHPTKGKALIYG
jgi:hypothetical protein